MGQILTVRELLLEQGEHILDRYLLGEHVLAVEVTPDKADTCVIGELHGKMGVGTYLCLKQVNLSDEIDADEQNVLQITKKTWDKSLTQNFLKSKLDEWKQEQQGN